jgi:hypothetical protein
VSEVGPVAVMRTGKKRRVSRAQQKRCFDENQGDVHMTMRARSTCVGLGSGTLRSTR